MKKQEIERLDMLREQGKKLRKSQKRFKFHLIRCVLICAVIPSKTLTIAVKTAINPYINRRGES